MSNKNRTAIFSSPSHITESTRAGYVRGEVANVKPSTSGAWLGAWDQGCGVRLPGLNVAIVDIQAPSVADLLLSEPSRAGCGFDDGADHVLLHVPDLVRQFHAACVGNRRHPRPKCRPRRQSKERRSAVIHGDRERNRLIFPVGQPMRGCLRCKRYRVKATLRTGRDRKWQRRLREDYPPDEHRRKG